MRTITQKDLDLLHDGLRLRRARLLSRTTPRGTVSPAALLDRALAVAEDIVRLQDQESDIINEKTHGVASDRLDSPYWLDRDKKMCYPRQMSDEHILNTLSYIEGNAYKYHITAVRDHINQYNEYDVVPFFNADWPNMYRVISEHMNRKPDAFVKSRKIYRLLKLEAARRGLLHY